MSNNNKVTERVDAIRAAKFMLAIADDDGAKALAVLCEAADDERGPIAFCAELAAIGIGLAQTHIGEHWRSIIGNAIVDLEMSVPFGTDNAPMTDVDGTDDPGDGTAGQVTEG